MSKILILHALRSDYPETVFDFVRSFGLYASGHELTYINALAPVRIEDIETEFDVVLVTYDLLAHRLTAAVLLKRFRKTIDRANTVVLITQDDYTMPKIIEDLALHFEINAVVSPVSHRAQDLYPRLVSLGIPFLRVLTGYIEESRIPAMERFRLPFKKRSIDFGQRVRLLDSLIFGDFAVRKGRITESFADRVASYGFTCDASTSEEDRLIGVEWFKFLGNCRFTLTSESGASQMDPSGYLRLQVEFLRRFRRNSSSDYIARTLQLDRKSEKRFEALSGRFFEAAALGVCQILLPGTYPSGLVPWIHYIPMKEDLSNLKEVVNAMKETQSCEQMADNCFKLIMKDQTNTYRGFVESVLNFLGISRNTSFSAPVSVRDLTDDLAILLDYPGTVSPMSLWRTRKRFVVKHGLDWSVHSVTSPWVPAFQTTET